MNKRYCDACGNETNHSERMLFSPDEPEIHQWIGDVCINCQQTMRDSVGITKQYNEVSEID